VSNPKAGPAAVVAHTFPTDDAVFGARVTELLARERRRVPERVCTALEANLRPTYPDVRTSVRADIAGFGGVVVYVYRDGTPVSKLGSDEWVESRESARVVFDASGVFIDANDAAAGVFGVPREEIVGTQAETFVPPDARIRDPRDLWRRLEAKGRLHSLAIVRRPDGTPQRVEFVTVKDGDGPGRNVTFLRSIG
jgi:PAS domain S-box-containing protein